MVGHSHSWPLPPSSSWDSSWESCVPPPTFASACSPRTRCGRKTAGRTGWCPEPSRGRSLLPVAGTGNRGAHWKFQHRQCHAWARKGGIFIITTRILTGRWEKWFVRFLRDEYKSSVFVKRTLIRKCLPSTYQVRKCSRQYFAATVVKRTIKRSFLLSWICKE